MFRSTLMAALLAAAGCAAPMAMESQGAAPATARQGVEEFIRAAADSNLARMAELFGTDRGSVRKTGQPRDYPQRMVVIQAYLAGVSVRALSEVDTGRRDHLLVPTEISRGTCKVTVPVTAVRTAEGWLVREFDLAMAAEVNKPC